MSNINEDLTKERRKCNFNVEELTNYLDGGAAQTANRRKQEEEVLQLGIKDEVPEEYLSHKEKYENSVRKAVIYYGHKLRTNLELDITKRNSNNLRDMTTEMLFKDVNPFSLHFSMFIPCLIGQANDEQKDYWLRRALNLEIIGTYAQTELGHGTFIRGLETTATYDASTEEFILHSPSLSAYKWWPGGLAHTANYCVVMAQLYVNNKSCGIQPFIVQVRDEETHMPLPGIKIGEIGAKLGFNNVNNGFLGFEQHRIPRSWMLMRNSQVTKDGNFIASKNDKLTYGTMVFVRVLILNGTANDLARAATIATRYSAIRHQSKKNPNEPEPQVIEYLTQQHKLFIAIASSYAYSIIAKSIWIKYTKITADLASGNLEDLPELHALTCCLKAIFTLDSVAMVERLRMACGGHGYMLSSNLPLIYGHIAASATYEGEHVVLLLQTARFLIKAYGQALQGKQLSKSTAYLADKTSMTKWENSIDCIVRGFKKAAAGKVILCAVSLEKQIKKGLTAEEAWDSISIKLISATESHGRAYMLETLHSEIKRTSTALSEPVKKVLFELVELYTIYWALERLSDLLLYTPISGNDVQELQRRYEELLSIIRPNAVGLVDAFDWRDEVLQSTLGAYDGRVYERLMEEALKSPLNKEPVNKSFHLYLKPFMQGKL